jgi:hypothetical protein
MVLYSCLNVEYMHVMLHDTDSVLCASQSDKKKTAAATDGDETAIVGHEIDADNRQHTGRQKSISSAHGNINGINMQRARSYSSGILQMQVADTPSLTKQQLKAAKDSEPMAPLSALWALNKPDVLYIIIGLIGAVTVGAMMPVQGIVMAYLQVCALLMHVSKSAFHREHRIANSHVVGC